MTISPPSKVNTNSRNTHTVLTSGIDSLVLTIDVYWNNSSLFKYLHEMKDIAKAEEKDTAVAIGKNNDSTPLYFTLKPYGVNGYEWVLLGQDYTLKIGNWREPKSRPSIIAQIHSEALWSLSPQIAVKILLKLLINSGASFKSVNASRVDLCVDMLLPQSKWSVNLIKYIVSRATYRALHFYNDTLTGLSIGKGRIAARLYDKPLEISQKSKKTWMYKIWGLDSVPENYKIIRYEVQFRREGIKELGIDSIFDFFNHPENFWAYFSKKWLKFQNNPKKHHSLRKTLPAWRVIQNGFLGVQNAQPLIRCKSIQTKKKQQFSQAYGSFNSFIAINQEQNDQSVGHEESFKNSLEAFEKYFNLTGKNDMEFNIDIIDKRARYQRARKKMQKAHEQRKELGFPSNLPIELIPESQNDEKE